MDLLYLYYKVKFNFKIGEGVKRKELQVQRDLNFSFFLDWIFGVWDERGYFVRRFGIWFKILVVRSFIGIVNLRS